MLKTKRFLAATLIATLGFTGCSSKIQAKPNDYDKDLLTFAEDDEVYHNLVSIIEDSYRDGSLAGDVLNQVLYQYATSIFGRYNKITKGVGDYTLKDAAKDITKNSDVDAEGKRTTNASALKAETVAFIDGHKAYHSLDNDGNRLTTDEDKQSEFDRVMAKWQTIEDRIAIAMYDEIKGGSYSERGEFSEKKLLVSLKAGTNRVADYKATTTQTHENVVFTPDVEDVDVFETDGYLYRNNYQKQAAYDLTLDEEEQADEDEIKYVEDNLVPTIYRTLLVEQYLLDESYNTLGRSYARKVNVISITNNSYNTYLLQDFVRETISKGKTVGLEEFNQVSAFNVGLRDKIEEITGKEFGNSETQQIMANFGYEYVAETASGAEDDYYKGTDYGDMMQEYRKITNDILTTDTSAESDFTGSYTYSKETGKKIKENELANKDYTKNGWYIKNGGLTELPDEIRTRLFNIGVANALDNENYVDRWQDGAYSIPEGEKDYVAKINGKYYLKVGKKEAGAPITDDILFNVNGTSYIIQIEEAISASKLAKDANEENGGYNRSVKEEIINEVAKVIASDESYKTLSTKHWLEKCALNYHDTVVYDYFKSNYPDLFED